MSDDENLSGYSSDQDDKLRDMELMNVILESIDNLKTSGAQSISAFPEDVRVNMSQKTSVPLHELSVVELKLLLEQVSQALEYNSSLQSVLLMKELKLIALKRQITATKSNAHNHKGIVEEELKGDIGKYIVKFKAPYFKNSRDFAGYVIVPEKKLPTAVQSYVQKAVQWTMPDLKDLEWHVRKFLSDRSYRCMMENNPSTTEEKRKLIDEYSYMRNKATLASLVPSDFDEIIDWCHIASKLKKTHSPHECQKAWNIYLKPSINRKKWKLDEKEKLKKLALEHNYEEWDDIARKLGTCRSGYQCFLQYQDLIMKMVEGEWSKAEGELLVKLVKDCTYGGRILWHKIAYFFETRSLPQIYRKWKFTVLGKNIKAGNFSEEDDRIILDQLLINKDNINHVAKILNRIPSQIRYRFSQLKSSLTHKYGEWSLDEDKQLMSLVEKYGNKNWATIAQHLPSRGRVQIRHRYTHIRKRMSVNPNIKLADFSRTKRTVYQQRKKSNMKYILNQAGIKGKQGKKKESEGIDLDTPLGKIILHNELLVDESKKILKKRSKIKKKTKIIVEEDRELSSKPVKADVFPDVYPKLVDFYVFTSAYCNTPIDPKSCIKSRLEVLLVNSFLNYSPCRHIDIKNSEWSFSTDRSDPYSAELFRLVENTDHFKSERSRKTNWLFPPSLATLEGFYNILVDMDLVDMNISGQEAEKELETLYSSDDDEMVTAVNKWRERLKTLFLWPNTLSEIDLMTKHDDNPPSRSNLARISDSCQVVESTSEASNEVLPQQILLEYIDSTFGDKEIDESSRQLTSLVLDDRKTEET